MRDNWPNLFCNALVEDEEEKTGLILLEEEEEEALVEDEGYEVNLMSWICNFHKGVHYSKSKTG